MTLRPAFTDLSTTATRRSVPVRGATECQSDWQATDGVHARAVAFVISKLHESGRTHNASWAVQALGMALNRIGEANEANRGRR